MNKTETKNCSNCGSDLLRWWVDKKGLPYIQDGRLKLNEISVIAYLACEECSETLNVINEDEIK